jgi:hypothetical protein
MKKEAYNNYSPTSVSPYGVKMYGPDILQSDVSILTKIINRDHSLDESKKQSVLAMLNNPTLFKSLISGVAGAAVIRSAVNFEKMSKPAQALVTLAGFGLGKYIYDILHDPEKFSSYDSNTGLTKIKI